MLLNVEYRKKKYLHYKTIYLNSWKYENNTTNFLCSQGPQTKGQISDLVPWWEKFNIQWPEKECLCKEERI